MRKSVVIKQNADKQMRLRASARHKRIVLWLMIPLFGAVCALIISVANNSAQGLISAYKKDSEQNKAEAARYATIAAKKRAEAAAIASMKAATSTTGTTERDVAAAKQTEPATTATCGVNDPSNITVVINKKHCFSPLDWAPSDLASIDGTFLRQVAADQMQRMQQAAAADNISFTVASAYRSYADQQSTYNYWVQVNGSAAVADTVSARAGYSEHQTGLAADLKVGTCALECFSTTAAYTWLTQHAADYGFINRYPANLSDITGYAPEAWHWRYVGAATALDMEAKGIQTLEEYLGISGGSY